MTCSKCYNDSLLPTTLDVGVTGISACLIACSQYLACSNPTPLSGDATISPSLPPKVGSSPMKYTVELTLISKTCGPLFGSAFGRILAGSMFTICDKGISYKIKGNCKLSLYEFSKHYVILHFGI